MPLQRYWDGTAWQDVFASAGYDTTPIGAVITHTGSTAPFGCLLANGQQVSELDYPDLAKFAATEVGLGNPLWAISGSTPSRTITVPDLTDRFLYSKGTKALGVKSQTNPALANPGEETHLLLTGEAAQKAVTSGNDAPDHSHTITSYAFQHGGVAAANPNYIGGTDGYTGVGAAAPPYGWSNSGRSAFHQHVMTGANASAAMNNMPPYCVLAFYIKAKGIIAPNGVAVGPSGPPGLNGAPGGQVWTQIIGDGVATNFTVDHNLATKNVTVSIYRSVAPFDEIEADVERTTVNRITIRTMPTVPAIGEYTVVVAAPGQQATLNITMDGWHTVGAAGEPAFQNSWSSTGGIYGPFQFRKNPEGKVQFRGTIQGGATNTSVFTLPTGYRPPGYTYIPVLGDAGGAGNYIGIDSAGVVVGTRAGSAIHASNVEFDTDTVLQTASVAAQPIEPWHNIGAAGEPAFQNSWVAFSTDPSAASQPSFRKFPDGRVRLKGGVKGGVYSGTPFTLPVGYRPTQYLRPVIATNVGATQLEFKPDGTFFVNNGSVGGAGGYYFLDGIEFDTESVAAYTTGLIPAVTAFPPAFKHYGSGGPSAAVPAGGWTATHTDGSSVNHVITPSIDCWWPCKMNVLARVLDAVWCRLECRIKIDPVDADGLNWSNGSIMHHSGACDWMQVAGGARTWKLNKGTTYTLTMQLYAVTGTWNVYRAPEHMWLAHDGIIPR
jgi:hypothetical protein